MFDYIIIGAGSAGCVMANRLSENPDTSVCLLEAGPSDANPLHKHLIKVPLGISLLMWHPVLNWGYYSEKESRLNNRRMYSPRGKVLGGSSASNAMVYIRGQAEDFNHWASLGNKGWDWLSLLPLFKRQENQQRGANMFHGVDGPLCVDDPTQTDSLCHTFINAGRELGYTQTTDFNGASQEGFGVFQMTQKKGERWSSARAHLHPIRNRKNLHVITDAHVSRILFQGKKATGVEYLQDKATYKIKAAKEIVLSGGAFNSPQLLLLSGIGPEDELKKHQIPVTHALEGVGKNLQDHLDIILRQKNCQNTGYGLSFDFALTALKAPFRYLISRSGFLASNAAEAGAFVKTDGNLKSADLQLHFTPTYLKRHGRSKPPLGHVYSLHLCNLHPKSRGRVTLHSREAGEAPKILYNYLHHPDDMNTMIKAVKFGRKILQTDAFKPYRKEELAPGNAVQSDRDIEAFIREEAESIYHPVGTCKMGNDSLAVVDDQLRVHGLEALRVVDASIMPTLIGGNTNATTMVIAEKAADLILKTESGQHDK